MLLTVNTFNFSSEALPATIAIDSDVVVASTSSASKENGTRDVKVRVALDGYVPYFAYINVYDEDVTLPIYLKQLDTDNSFKVSFETIENKLVPGALDIVPTSSNFYSDRGYILSYYKVTNSADVLLKRASFVDNGVEPSFETLSKEALTGVTVYPDASDINSGDLTLKLEVASVDMLYLELETFIFSTEATISGRSPVSTSRYITLDDSLLSISVSGGCSEVCIEDLNDYSTGLTANTLFNYENGSRYFYLIPPSGELSGYSTVTGYPLSLPYVYGLDTPNSSSNQSYSICKNISNIPIENGIWTMYYVAIPLIEPGASYSIGDIALALDSIGQAAVHRCLVSSVANSFYADYNNWEIIQLYPNTVSYYLDSLPQRYVIKKEFQILCIANSPVIDTEILCPNINIDVRISVSKPTKTNGLNAGLFYIKVTTNGVTTEYATNSLYGTLVSSSIVTITTPSGGSFIYNTASLTISGDGHTLIEAIVVYNALESQLYSVGEVVFYNGKIYSCHTQNTANSGQLAANIAAYYTEITINDVPIAYSSQKNIISVCEGTKCFEDNFTAAICVSACIDEDSLCKNKAYNKAVKTSIIIDRINQYDINLVSASDLRSITRYTNAINSTCSCCC